MKARASFVVFVYVVAANVPLWIASKSFGFLLKGLFNIEFVIIGILSLFLRRSLVAGLLMVAILADILSAVSMTYMLGARELLRSGRSLFEFAPSHTGDLVVLIGCISVVCLMAFFGVTHCANAKERRSLALSFVAFAALCVVVDVSTGQMLIRQRDQQTGSIRLSRLTVRRLFWVESQRRDFKEAVGGTDTSVASASRMMVGFNPALQARVNAQAPNLVLILVESWGKPVATDMEESLVRPYSDNKLQERYTLTRGTVPFYGPTVDGEARELCGTAIGFGVLAASSSELKGCLPEQLRRKGYGSVAVHGFGAGMFDRGEWYSRIGFDEAWFRDRLEQQRLPLCPGPFPGVCDAAISEWIGDRLQRSAGPPEFIYWVTLNSHLPVPVENLVKDPPSCSVLSATAENSAVCSWYQLVFNVHRSVAELASRSTTRPTAFLIVGDHAPPFASDELRSQFSDQVVPYVLLMPKTPKMREGLPAIRAVVATHTPAGKRKPHAKSGKGVSQFPVVG